MAKLIRCEAGHVFDGKAHKVCPECARLGIVHHSAPDKRETTTADDAKTGSPARRLATAAGLAIPFLWLAVGGAAAVAVTVGFVALRSSGPAPRQSPQPQTQSALQVQPPQPPAPAAPLPTPAAPPPAPQPALPQALPAFPAPTPPPPAAPENYALAQRVPGLYKIDGRNPNGSRYGGKVLITAAETGVYNFLWRISNGETYRGRGRLSGDMLTVEWGQQYPVIYRVNIDGTLRGRWDNGRGIENLIPD
jgi:hypothetical protein